jgi:hypothetical protein
VFNPAFKSASSRGGGAKEDSRECAFEEVEGQSSTYLTVAATLVVAVILAATARPPS